jgi:hypothetical protein
MPVKKTELDDLDYTIMLLLSQFLTYQEISNKVGKTVSTIQWRIGYLLENGYITHRFDESMNSHKTRSIMLTPKGAEALAAQGTTIQQYQVARGDPKRII